MLVLSRKLGEAIVIDGDIIVRVIRFERGQFKIGIEAPDEVTINRAEIEQRIIDGVPMVDPDE